MAVPRPPDRESLPLPKRPRPAIPSPAVTSISHSEDYDDIQEVVPVKTEPRDPPPPPTTSWPTRRRTTRTTRSTRWDRSTREECRLKGSIKVTCRLSLQRKAISVCCVELS